MIKRKRTIIWNAHCYEFDSNENVFVEGNNEEHTYDDSQDTINLGESLGALIPIRKRMMQTPYGIFDVDDALNPYKQFEFWMGHTNFDINDTVFNILENTDGVEQLKVLSPYRFIVAIGKAFNFTEVREDIQNKLCDTNKKEDIEYEIIKLKTLLSKHKKWAIYTLPNGKIDYTFTDEENNQEFNEKVQIYRISSQTSNGHLITSETADDI